MTTTINKLDGTGTITGTVILDYDMIWTDEETWNPIISESEATIQGGFTDPMEIKMTDEIGRNITLESNDGYGRQYKSTIVALRALVEPETKYQLIIDFEERGIDKYVVFRNWESESEGAVQFSMVNQRDGIRPDTAAYDGKILMRVCAAP